MQAENPRPDRYDGHKNPLTTPADKGKKRRPVTWWHWTRTTRRARSGELKKVHVISMSPRFL